MESYFCSPLSFLIDFSRSAYLSTGGVGCLSPSGGVTLLKMFSPWSGINYPILKINLSYLLRLFHTQLYLLVSKANLDYHTKLLILDRSEEHTSELQSLMRISYAVFCLKKKKIKNNKRIDQNNKHIN